MHIGQAATNQSLSAEYAWVCQVTTWKECRSNNLSGTVTFLLTMIRMQCHLVSRAKVDTLHHINLHDAVRELRHSINHPMTYLTAHRPIRPTEPESGPGRASRRNMIYV